MGQRADVVCDGFSGKQCHAFDLLPTDSTDKHLLRSVKTDELDIHYPCYEKVYQLILRLRDMFGGFND